jgi:hypothetical protein
MRARKLSSSGTARAGTPTRSLGSVRVRVRVRVRFRVRARVRG